MERLAIAIAGASCSGKTTLANLLCEKYESNILRLDDYYRPLGHLTYEARCEINFDHPDAIDHIRLTEDVKRLLAGQSVETPLYDFTKHDRFLEVRRVEPHHLLVIEGLFALAYPPLIEQCVVRIFVDAPHDVCLERRVQRDVRERGRTIQEVTARFEEHVWPMYLEHILPTAEHCTAHVSGVGPADEIFGRLEPDLVAILGW